MSPELSAAIARLKEKGDALGEAIAAEQALEDQRPLLKEMAILRIMDRDKCSASSAKDIVKSDMEYMNHRIAQKKSTVAHYRADAEYEAAKAEVTQASRITPDVLLLEAELYTLKNINRHLTRELAAENERLTIANGANADLVRANLELAGELVTASDTINLLNQSLRVAGVS